MSVCVCFARAHVFDAVRMLAKGFYPYMCDLKCSRMPLRTYASPQESVDFLAKLKETIAQKAKEVIDAMEEGVHKLAPEYEKLCEDRDEKALKALTLNGANPILPKITAKVSAFASALQDLKLPDNSAEKGFEITSYLRTFLGVCHVANVVYVLLPSSPDPEAVKATTKAKLKSQKIAIPTSLFAMLD